MRIQTVLPAATATDFWDVAGYAKQKEAASTMTAADLVDAALAAVHAGSRSVGYGEIVRRGNLVRRFSDEQMKSLPIKAAAKRTLIGKPTKALDVPRKTNGTAVYGIDVEIPGMVYARPKLPPTRYGSKILSVDDSAARRIKGYKQSILLDDPSGTVPGWVMAIAETYYAALRATELVDVQWHSGETSTQA